LILFSLQTPTHLLQCISSHLQDLGAQHILVGLKKQVHDPPKMLFCRPAPAARGSLPVSKGTKPLSGKHKLEAGRFPPSSRMSITNHLVSSDAASETISSRLWATNCCSSICFFAFSALKFEAEAEPACRNRPTTSRSSPFSSISAFNLPKSIIIGLRHCVYLADSQTALLIVLLKLKACARLHACGTVALDYSHPIRRSRASRSPSMRFVLPQPRDFPSRRRRYLQPFVCNRSCCSNP